MRLLVKFINVQGNSDEIHTWILKGRKMRKAKSHHVVPNPDGGWDIRKSGATRASRHFDRKADAVDRARQISQNQRTELMIHDKRGRISQKDSHGNDPCPPKG